MKIKTTQHLPPRGELLNLLLLQHSLPQCTYSRSVFSPERTGCEREFCQENVGLKAQYGIGNHLQAHTAQALCLPCAP